MGSSRTVAQYSPVVDDRPLVPLMNDTKWDELRLAMSAIEPSPSFSTVDSETGHRSDPDCEWFYHFRTGGYVRILLVDIDAQNTLQRDAVRTALKSIGVPGEETDSGFRVYGYATEGQAVDYIR